MAIIICEYLHYKEIHRSVFRKEYTDSVYKYLGHGDSRKWHLASGISSRFHARIQRYTDSKLVSAETRCFLGNTSVFGVVAKENNEHDTSAGSVETDVDSQTRSSQ